YVDHPNLHSFPTRRSSDLSMSIVRGLSARTKRARAPGNFELSGKCPTLIMKLECCFASNRHLCYDKSRDERTDFYRRFCQESLRSEEHTSELQSRGHLVCR